MCQWPSLLQRLHDYLSDHRHQHVHLHERRLGVWCLPTSQHPRHPHPLPRQRLWHDLRFEWSGLSGLYEWQHFRRLRLPGLGQRYALDLSLGLVEAGQKLALASESYRDCAVVEEVRGQPSRVTGTTYCKGAGPVRIEMRVYNPMKMDFETIVRASLLSVTRPEAGE